jgi:hypothetical protein
MIILNLVLVPGLMEAADWTPVMKGPAEDVVVSVDRESIERNTDNVVRAWIKYRYSKPKPFDSGDIKELRVNNEYDCKNAKKYKIHLSVAYLTDGTVQADSSERQGYILPDDATFNYLCK